METQLQSPVLFLASMSPRRSELMTQLGLEFEMVNAPIEEVALPNENAESFVRRMAIEKALAGFNKVAGKEIWVVGGDTSVTCQSEVFGKPRNQADAVRMLQKLSGQTQEVLSALAVVHDGQVFSKVQKTKVQFRELSQAEILEYWDSGEPQGKAGAYAIQGLGAKFIESIDGSYSAVMGLPLFELDQLLIESGYKK